MSKHTKEPWDVIENDYYEEFIFSDGYIEAGPAVLSKEKLADARRIVACVNACAGIPTELIEQGGFAAVPVETHRAVKAQRDELLDIVKEVVRTGRLDMAGIEIARTTIAKAEAAQ